MFRSLITLILVSIFPLKVLSGQQFGLEIGETKKSVTSKGVILEDTGGYWYFTNKLPNGNPKFKEYGLIITPKSGLCKIVAYTDYIYSNSFGTELKSEFNFFATALENKYGNSEKYDFLSSGSIWKGNNYWMMGLLKKERYLQNVWSKKYGSNLPNYINFLSVKAMATSSDEGSIIVSYEFSNNDECFKEQDELQTQNL